jgi:hypothetical protein
MGTANIQPFSTFGLVTISDHPQDCMTFGPNSP